MLRFLRSHANSWVMKILLGILVLSFGLFWGITEFFRTSSSRGAVATVGKESVSKEYLKHIVQGQLKALESELKGKSLTLQQAQERGWVLQYLQRLINEIVISLYGKQHGLVISDGVLIAMIQSEPLFQDIHGAFSRDKLEAVLSANGLSEQGYVQSRRLSLIQTQLLSALGVGAVAPARLTMNFFKAATERRTFKVYSFNPEAISIPATEQQLRDFYKRDKASFEVPEIREATLILLVPEEISKKMAAALTSQDLAQSYKEQQELYVIPERRDLAVVRCITPQEIEETQSLLSQGKETPPERTTLLKGVTRQELQAAVAGIAFRLSESQYSPPLKIGKDSYIIFAKKVIQGGVEPFAAVKDKILSTLAAQRAREKIAQLSQKIEDRMNQGQTLEVIAKDLNVPLTKVSLDAMGRNREGKPVRISADIVRDLFALPPSVVNSLTELSDETLYVGRVDKIEKASVPEFEVVRSKVEQAYRKQERQKSLKKLVNFVKEKLDRKEEVQVGGALSSSLVGPISLATASSGEKKISSLLLEKGFSTKVGTPAVLERGEQIVVAVPLQVEKPDVEKNLALYAQLKTELGKGLQKECLDAFLISLREHYKVEINQEAVRSIGEN